MITNLKVLILASYKSTCQTDLLNLQCMFKGLPCLSIPNSTVNIPLQRVKTAMHYSYNSINVLGRIHIFSIMAFVFLFQDQTDLLKQ